MGANDNPWALAFSDEALTPLVNRYTARLRCDEYLPSDNGWKVNDSSDSKINKDEEDEEAVEEAEYYEKHYPIHTENDTDRGG